MTVDEHDPFPALAYTDAGQSLMSAGVPPINTGLISVTGSTTSGPFITVLSNAHGGGGGGTGVTLGVGVGVGFGVMLGEGEGVGVMLGSGLNSPSLLQDVSSASVKMSSIIFIVKFYLKSYHCKIVP